MRIAFLGTGEFGVPALGALRAAGHEVVVAISQPDRPSGRGMAIQPTAIRTCTEALGIPHIQSADVNVAGFATSLRGAEVAIVAAFGQKLGADLLAALPRGFVNIHASLLPRHRGAAPYQWAILSGDTITGVTVFQINERWDAGAIWAQRETPIGETETADELHDRLAMLGAEVIVEALKAIESGTATPRPQSAALATRAPKLSKSDGYVDFGQPAFRVTRRINGSWSWPAVACMFQPAQGLAQRVQLARARMEDDSSPPRESFPPGSLLADGSVQTGTGRVRVLEIKAAGGRLLKFEEFARGRNVSPPARFIPVDRP